MYFKNQTFFVFGLSLSGCSATASLLKNGAEVYVFDEEDSPRVSKAYDKLSRLGAKVVKNLDFALEKSSVIVVSPGVRADNEILVRAKRKNKRIIGEVELGFILSKAPVIAVTGTNGKTTTCSMIFEALNSANINSRLVGNVGIPFCNEAEFLNREDIFVCEVSSFQLETVHSFCPHIAVVLNVTEDHLDRHYTMDNYIFLKSRILKNMRESEFAVLNYDDEIVRSFANKTKAKIVWFSRREKVDGAYIENEAIFYNGEKIIDLENLALKGGHNEENALATVCALKIVGALNNDICCSLSSFKGVKHRIELVLEKGGVKYYNDSKSTNVDSAIKAIDLMQTQTVIILGGKDKNQDYSKLFEKIKNSPVTHAVLMGENRYKLLQSASEAEFYKVSVSSSFESAIKIAKIEARGSGAVLLSPATSSFDMFCGFEERGAEFTRIVKAIND